MALFSGGVSRKLKSDLGTPPPNGALCAHLADPFSGTLLSLLEGHVFQVLGEADTRAFRQPNQSDLGPFPIPSNIHSLYLLDSS